VVNAGEQCDDGNALDGDGCDSNCKITACGNGIKTAASSRRRNLIDNDGCDHNCTLPACRNGVVNAGEQCDDGNSTTAMAATTLQAHACGNGITTAPSSAMRRRQLRYRDMHDPLHHRAVRRWLQAGHGGVR